MVLSDSSNGDIGWKKWLIAGWAFMECLFFGGLLYGWGSIVFVLKDEGIYADLCPRTGNTSGSGNITHDVTFVPVKSQNETGNNTGYIVNSTDATLSPGSGAPAGGKDVICKPQDSNYALCFTIGSALFCLGCAVLGHVNYKYGTRVTRILSFLTFVAGTLMMAFISKEHPWLMFPGLSLMGIGGLPILVTNTQVSNLFSTGSSTFVGLLCGGFDMSSAVMLMVKLAYEGGFSRQYMFLLICGAHLLVLVSTFFFLPREFIPRPKVKVIEREVAENEEVGIKLIDKSANVEVNPPRATRPSLRSCMLKPMFVSHVLWLSILQVRFYYFVGSINQYLNRLFDEDKDEVSKFTNMCFTIMMGGLITSPMAGIVYDLVKKLCKDGKSQPYREVLPAALPLAVGSLLAVLLSVLVLIPSTGLLYLIFVVMTLFRSFLYSMAAAFLSAVFPSVKSSGTCSTMLLSDSKRSWVKYALAGWAFIECLLFAGILYGWGSLVFIFKSEGIYADLCGYDDHVHSVDKMNKSNINVYRNNGKLNTSNPSVHFIHSTSSTLTETLNNHNGNTTVTVTKGQSCLAQDSRMSLCFTISSSIFCVSCVVMGAVNYKLGTRLTRLIAFPFFIAGSLCFVFLSKDRPWLMFPGLSLIGIGGLPVFVTNTQVSNLFKSGSSSVVGLIVGGYDMSSAVFLVIKLGFHRGFSHQKGFAVLCGMHVMTLVSTFLFLPKGFIEQREDPTTGCQGDEGGRRLSEGLLKKRAQLPRQRSMTVMEYRVRGRRPSLADTQPLSSYLRQPLFLTHSLWLCILQLRFYFFIGNLNTFLTRVLDNDTQQVSYFTNACFYTMMGGLFTSFLAGIVYDSQKAIFKGGQSKLYRRLMPALLPVSLASLLTVVLSVLVLVPSPAVLYVIFIVMTLLRSFLYSVAAAFIQEIFPSQYFALLYGVTMIAAGLFSLFQYALFSWSESYHNGPKHVEVFLLCAGVLSAIHPLYMLVCAIREERSTRQDDQPQLGSAEGTGNREKVETVFTD